MTNKLTDFQQSLVDAADKWHRSEKWLHSMLAVGDHIHADKERIVRATTEAAFMELVGRALDVQQDEKTKLLPQEK